MTTSSSFDTLIAEALANNDESKFRRAIILASTLRQFQRLHAHAPTFKCIGEVEDARAKASIPSGCFSEFFSSDLASLRPQS